MASSTKILPFIFLLTTLVCSIQTHARDSQFFSKVTRDREDSTTIPTTTTPNSNKKDDFVPLAKLEKADEQPTFLPQTTETGYGLYGHETGLDPPSTTTTSLYNMDHENTKNNNENFNNNYYKQRNNNNQYHHDRNYVPELKGLSMDDATTYTEKFPSKGWSYNKNNVEDKFFDENNHQKNENFNNYYMNKNNENDHEVKGLSYNNGQGKFYNGVEAEKQGMSDTRFMENGKYFYDLNADNNNKYDIPNNNYMSYSNNNYNNNGYYGNKETNYEEMYNNNKNKFYNTGNGMQKYQSQVPDEEEFDFDQP